MPRKNNMPCPRCGGNQVYKTKEDNITWWNCPSCGSCERIKHYTDTLKKATDLPEKN